MMGIRDAFIFPLSPPPISELGHASGFTFRLQDRGGKGHEALLAARNQLLGMASKSKVLTQVRPEGLEDAPQLQIDIDRDKASALSVAFDSINSTISTALGSTYINDFPNQGRLQRVVVQADAPHGCRAMTCCGSPPNNAGQTGATLEPSPRPAGSRARCRPSATTATRPCALAARPRPATARVTPWRKWKNWRRCCPKALPLSGPDSRAKRSWPAHRRSFCTALPFWPYSCAWPRCMRAGPSRMAVILVVPLGVLGVLLATLMRGYANDVYFQVGLITIIGLSAKNAILIIEFAKDLQAQGKTAVQAALAAAHMRFRPILMTSMAFMLGVLPLVISSGAGSASQRAIGTGVIGGMMLGTLLAVFFVPIFFVVVRSPSSKAVSDSTSLILSTVTRSEWTAMNDLHIKTRRIFRFQRFAPRLPWQVAVSYRPTSARLRLWHHISRALAHPRWQRQPPPALQKQTGKLSSTTPGSSA
jgi:multidrug efflux pump